MILGDGPAREELTALVHKLGLEGRVDLPGYVSDVAGWLKIADLFALSSVYEGMPAVVLEALSLRPIALWPPVKFWIRPKIALSLRLPTPRTWRVPWIGALPVHAAKIFGGLPRNTRWPTGSPTIWPILKR